jgi:hypothetical protein
VGILCQVEPSQRDRMLEQIFIATT